MRMVTPFTPPPLTVTFTNDAQINQLAVQLGVFDDQEPLTVESIPRKIACRFAQCEYAKDHRDSSGLAVQ